MNDETNLAVEIKNLKRRKFLNHTIMGMTAFGVGSFLWMLTRATNTTTETNTAADLKINLTLIPQGSTKTIAFKGSPLSIRHRTQTEMEKAERMFGSGLRDPYANNQLLHKKDTATNTNRSIAGNPAFIAVIASCTYKDNCALEPNAGDFNGWLCPCCSTHYDLAGRVIKGIAPRNLLIPRYRLTDNNILYIPD